MVSGRSYGSQEHGIILSTHILPEVQAVCTDVQIIHQGSLVFADSIAGLDARLRGTHLRVGLRRPPTLPELLAVPGVTSVDSLEDGRLRIGFNNDHNPAEALAAHAATHGWGLYELSPERMSLEQIFVDLTCNDPDSVSHEDAA